MLNKLKIKNLSKFKSRSGLRAIIANTGWLFADRIVRMGASLVVGVWVARYLGVQQYGLFNYALAFVSLFSPIFTLGLDDVVVRHIVRQSSRTGRRSSSPYCPSIIKQRGNFRNHFLAKVAGWNCFNVSSSWYDVFFR